MLRPEYTGKKSAEARFRREATTAARLRHPNIVFIRDVGEGEGTVFVAMDLLPLSLARRLEVLPRLPESEVVRFALEVAAALSIAHADGVVHRDIKPDNVMLGANGEAIVADFGLASAFTDDPTKKDLSVSDPGKVMGTPHYFSPEQARGLEVDGRSDLYSLGVMCYRAATGRLPFDGDDWYTVARQHVEDAPVSPRTIVPELTEGFEAIVLRLLAKQPEQRFASATQLVDALLVLPTAPASRGVGLTPSSASITQVAFPYVHNAVVPAARRFKTALLIGAVAIAAGAAFAYWGLPISPALQARIAGNDTGAAPVSVALDTTPVVAPDTNLLPGSTLKLPFTTPTKSATRPTNPLRTPALPAKVHVTLTAPESARLLVNNQIVGHGSWESDLPTGRQHHFRARLESTIPGCKSAEHDTSATFFSGQPVEINLEVASCSVLQLTVRSTDASYLLNALDFEFKKTERYRGIPQPIVLRNGRYELVVSSDKCNDYRDTTLVMGRNVDNGSDTVWRSIPMMCGTASRPKSRR